MNLSLDTHGFVKAFVAAKTEEEKAEVIIKTLSTIKDDSSSQIERTVTKAKSEAASKHDLEMAKLALTRDIETTKLALTQDIEVAKLALTRDIETTRLALTREIQSLRVEFKDDIKSTKLEIKSLEIRMLKWMFGMFLAFSGGQITIIIFVMKSFFKGVSGL